MTRLVWSRIRVPDSEQRGEIGSAKSDFWPMNDRNLRVKRVVRLAKTEISKPPYVRRLCLKYTVCLVFSHNRVFNCDGLSN